jgi:hypothetical protein
VKLPILLILAIITIVNCFGSTPVISLIDYLRESPASVGGSITLDKDFQLYNGKKSIFPVGMKINSKKDINYSFSEDFLSIDSEQGLSLTIAGMSFQVKNIYYNEKTGKFSVKTSTPLGIGAATLSSQVEQVLNEHYRPKMIKAFQELKTIRSRQSLRDVNEVISAISNIFSTGLKTPIPTIRGTASLIFNPRTKKNLKLDQWKAEIKQGDYLVLGMDFTKSSTGMLVNGVRFSSQQGIRISGKTNFPEINSILFKEMNANGQGITFGYDIGAEEVVAGFRILISTLQAYSRSSGDIFRECDPVRLEGIRKMIDGNLRREIAEMIRIHRRSLLNAGASPQLLAALD